MKRSTPLIILGFALIAIGNTAAWAYNSLDFIPLEGLWTNRGSESSWPWWGEFVMVVVVAHLVAPVVLFLLWAPIIKVSISVKEQIGEIVVGIVFVIVFLLFIGSLVGLVFWSQPPTCDPLVEECITIKEEILFLVGKHIRV